MAWWGWTLLGAVAAGLIGLWIYRRRPVDLSGKLEESRKARELEDEKTRQISDEEIILANRERSKKLAELAGETDRRLKEIEDEEARDRVRLSDNDGELLERADSIVRSRR